MDHPIRRHLVFLLFSFFRLYSCFDGNLDVAVAWYPGVFGHSVELIHNEIHVSLGMVRRISQNTVHWKVGLFPESP